MAQQIRQLLTQQNMLNQQNTGGGQHDFYVTDIPNKFKQTGEMFLGKTITNLTKVDLD